MANDPEISSSQALGLLRKGTLPFAEVFTHGTLSVEIYKPDKVDNQKPHDRDEVYVVIAGTGVFLSGERRWNFNPGDFLFAPAGAPHRFVEFSEDFSTWVIFYGPKGGEKAGDKA